MIECSQSWNPLVGPQQERRFLTVCPLPLQNKRLWRVSTPGLPYVGAGETASLPCARVRQCIQKGQPETSSFRVRWFEHLNTYVCAWGTSLCAL